MIPFHEIACVSIYIGKTQRGVPSARVFVGGHFLHEMPVRNAPANYLYGTLPMDLRGISFTCVIEVP